MFWPSERPTPKNLNILYINFLKAIKRHSWVLQIVSMKVNSDLFGGIKQQFGNVLFGESLPKIFWLSEQPTTQDFTFYTLIL
jgi:hypothetical protein